MVNSVGDRVLATDQSILRWIHSHSRTCSAETMHLLSKSTYMRGRQCPKSLWLYKHMRELRTEADPLKQAIFDTGTSVGLLAQQLFPGGVDCSPPTPFEYAQSVADTQAALARGERVIYEAAFLRDEVLAAMDILVHTDEGWIAYEVKSSSGVKEQYIHDAALQCHVISGSIVLADVRIVNLNSGYVKQGPIDVHRLFTTTSVKVQVDHELAEIPAWIDVLKAVVQQPEAPVVDIGPQCNAPYACDFQAHCWTHVPEHSVLELIGGVGKKWALYERGIVRLEDIPADEPLSAVQRRQVDAWTSGGSVVDRTALRTWLGELQYPVRHLDFETMNPAVPQYDGTRPFQQVPFQYSIHLQHAPGAEAEHREFLGDASGDPRETLLRQLLSDLGTTGDILAYYAPFERMVLRDLARDLPQYATAIQAVLPRIKDLMDPFKNGWYYAAEMNGSNSIKSVLPALVPELGYDGLAIQEGGTASLRFGQLSAGNFGGDVAQLRADLLAYCKMDTLAMVKVLGVLYGASA